MTGYPSPPPPPGQPYGHYTAPSVYERPWSALAIAAFVLAWLGFLGCTAILAIILAIAGIVASSGGKRRGMGLAIAAIPIALILGSISVLFLVGAYRVIEGVAHLPDKLEPILANKADVDPVGAVRLIASPALDAQLTDDEIRTWIAQIKEKHGTLVKLDKFGSGAAPTSKGSDGVMSIDLGAQFVNGRTTVVFVFRPEEMLSAKVDDLVVGAISLREVGAGGAAPAQPETPEPGE